MLPSWDTFHEQMHTLFLNLLTFFVLFVALNDYRNQLNELLKDHTTIELKHFHLLVCLLLNVIFNGTAKTVLLYSEH